MKNLQQFLFQVPLYAKFGFGTELSNQLLGDQDEGAHRLDGHCPYCHKASIFDIKFIPSHDGWVIDNNPVIDKVQISCGRNEQHVIDYFFFVEGSTIQKIGQYPSLADISIDQVTAYRRDLGNHNAAEFHKALGLAAHGVGVGSFVYLRRVFERLIQRRFEDFRSTEGWQDGQFYNARMEDKIKLLKDHLPEFLIQNSRIYSILSQGLHEMDEETCLGWFEIMKQSIIIILEDDKKKKEELERRASFSDAISGFSTPSDTALAP
ncbi:MAG: hypothetical protein OXI87_19510 [Albidovulum sp.]|nr:hypothetical protein [Albidovulum sp.]